MNSGKIRINLFYAVIALYWTSLYTYVPILSTYSSSEAIGASVAMAGTVLGSYGFSQMLVRIPLGILSDKSGKRKVFVIIGCGLSALSALGMALARTPMALLLFRTLSGVAASAWVTFTVLFSSYFDADKAPQAMAKAIIFNNLGQMTGMFLGGLFAQWMGSRTAFWLALVFGALGMALSLGITENKPSKAAPLRVAELLSVGVDRNLLFVSFLAVLYQILNQGATMGFTPLYLKYIGGTSAQQGYLTSISILGSMSMSYLSSKVLLRKVQTRYCIWTGQLVMALATCAIPLIGRSVPSVYLLQFFVGIGSGLSYPLLMGLSIKNVTPAKRGAAMGFFQSIYSLGMFIGPVLTGFLSDLFSLQISLVLVGCIGFVAFGAALVGLTPKLERHAA